MKQRKEFPAKKKESTKTVQELTDLIHQSIGKNPHKAAKVIETWVKDIAKPNKKAS
jgi:hypothetical protein